MLTGASSGDWVRRKLKFLEILLTLGSLLAIFLGFIVQKASILLGPLVALGVLFIVSALVSYTALLFPELFRAKWTKVGHWLGDAVMAASLAGLITLGASYYLSLSFSGNTLTPLGSIATSVVFVGSLVGVSELIRIVLRLEGP